MSKEKVNERFAKITQLKKEQSKVNNRFLKLLLLVVFLNLFSFASFGVECSFDIPDCRLGISGSGDETVTAEDVERALQTTLDEECVKAAKHPDEYEDIDYDLTLEGMRDNVWTVELSNVKSIGDNVFNQFNNLEEVDFDGTIEQWNKMKKGKGNQALRKAKVKCKDGDVENICIDFDRTNGLLDIVFTGEDGKVTAEDVDCAFRTALNQEYDREGKKPDEKYGKKLEKMRDEVKKVQLRNIRKIGDNVFDQFTNLKEVHSGKSKRDWKEVEIGEGNKVLEKLTVTCYDGCIRNMYGNFDRTNGVLDICAGVDGKLTAEDVDSIFRTALNQEYARLGLQPDEDGQYECRLAGMRNLVKEVHLRYVEKIGDNVFNQFGNLREVVFDGAVIEWNVIGFGIGKGNEVLNKVRVTCRGGYIDNIRSNFDPKTGKISICAGADGRVTIDDVKNAYKTVFNREYIRKYARVYRCFDQVWWHFHQNEYIGMLFEGLRTRVKEVELRNIKRIDDNVFKPLYSICNVVFHGTKAEWYAIDFGKGNAVLRRAKIKCEDGDIEGIHSDFDPQIGKLSICAGEDETVTREDVDCALYNYGLAKMRARVFTVELRNVRKIGDDVFDRFPFGSLREVHFDKSKTQWMKMEIGKGNSVLRRAKVEFVHGDIESMCINFDERSGKLSICVGADGTVTAKDINYVLKTVLNQEYAKLDQNPGEDKEYDNKLKEIRDAVLTVELKGRVKKIGDNIFNQFTNLQKVDFDGTQKHWNEIDFGEGNEILRRVEVKCEDRGYDRDLKRMRDGSVDSGVERPCKKNRC